jgi:glutamate N-acetyltransferase/amino-acid N-acetyltransferase
MAAAAVFTRNQFVAAPVTIGREHLAAGSIRTVLVNAGNANCATGEIGMTACHASCEAAAQQFGGLAEQVFPSSTGIIGVPLPVEKIFAALPELAAALGDGEEHAALFARAIMTTDTRPKIFSATVTFSSGEVQLLGFAKGAGMIHPQLVPHAPHATMLVYLFSDIAAEPAVLRQLLWSAADETFNCISIDGDTSTNDTVFLGATGASGVDWEQLSTAERGEFQLAVRTACESLAKQIVRDGEGARHMVQIDVTGSRTREEALILAKALAHSPLVKTAWAGEDPNWGRLISTIGATNVRIDPTALKISYGPHPVFADGQRSPHFDAAAVHAYLKQPEYTLCLDLGQGNAGCRFWTCDLTAEYVHINADYST